MFKYYKGTLSLNILHMFSNIISLKEPSYNYILIVNMEYNRLNRMKNCFETVYIYPNFGKKFLLFLKSCTVYF